MESSIVIKVMYGETLRRFNACLVDDKLGLNIDGLRDKIFQLFKFPPDSELTLTYIDEDGDVVTLVDDEDLQDITRQDLDPLRISVRLNTGKLSRSSGTSSGNAASFRTPLVKPTFPNRNSSVSDRFKFSRESKSRKIRKHSADMASKASSTAREIAELSKHLSKTGLSFLKLACPVVEGIAGSFRNGEPSQATNVEERTFKTAGQPKNHTGSTDAFASKFPQPDKTGIQCESLSKSPRPKSNLGDSKKEEGKKFGDCRLVGKALGISYSSSSTTGPGKRSNEQPSENHPRAEPVGAVGSYSLTGVHVLNSSSSTTGPEKRANKQPTENYPGAKPVGAVGSYSVTPVVNSSSLTTGPEKRANKQPSENHPGAEPVGAVCSYSVTGVPVVKDATQRQCSSFQVPIKKRSHNHSDRTASIFHRGVRCDGCGVHPITGPRFKSKVKEDYDLCSICFAQMGNDAHYIRMDHPVNYHHPAAFRASHDPCDFFQGWGVKSPKLDSRLTQGLNVLDGTIMAPLTPFTKVWRMRNNGNIVWPQGTRLVWIGGDRLSDAISVELQISSDGVAVDHDLDVAVDFTAPELPGSYISTWRMALPSGEMFGQSVWVLIQVFPINPPKKGVVYEASQDLNLNFPPASIGVAGSETINSNADMTTEYIISDPKISNPAMELVGPVVDGNRSKEQDSNSCISLSAAGSSISCPIDLSEAAPAVTSPAPLSVPEVQASSQDCRENSDIELTLLKELEDMGFKQVNLNKEVLRMNKYDLDQAVDDLCGISEWDPMLEELEGMGFCNKEMNKKLLKKNNGSIKRVVMDLIAGEN